MTIIDDRTILDQNLGDAIQVVEDYIGKRPVFLIRVPSDYGPFEEKYDMKPLPGIAGQQVLQVLGPRTTSLTHSGSRRPAAEPIIPAVAVAAAQPGVGPRADAPARGRAVVLLPRPQRGREHRGARRRGARGAAVARGRVRDHCRRRRQPRRDAADRRPTRRQRPPCPRRPPRDQPGLRRGRAQRPSAPRASISSRSPTAIASSRSRTWAGCSSAWRDATTRTSSWAIASSAPTRSSAPPTRVRTASR